MINEISAPSNKRQLSPCKFQKGLGANLRKSKSENFVGLRIESAVLGKYIYSTLSIVNQLFVAKRGKGN